MSEKIYLVSFHDRNGDIWASSVAATNHDEAFMKAYEELVDSEELMNLVDFPARFFVDEMEMN